MRRQDGNYRMCGVTYQLYGGTYQLYMVELIINAVWWSLYQELLWWLYLTVWKWSGRAP